MEVVLVVRFHRHVAVFLPNLLPQRGRIDWNGVIHASSPRWPGAASGGQPPRSAIETAGAERGLDNPAVDDIQ
jgi:hypothetical protein